MHSQHNIYEPEALDDPPKSPFAQHITQGSLQKKLSIKVCILSQPAWPPSSPNVGNPKKEEKKMFISRLF